MVRWLGRGPLAGALAGALVVGAATSSVAAGTRLVDGGVLDGSPAKRAAAAAASAASGPQEVIKLSQKIEIDGEEYFYSGPLAFDWTSDTVSLLVYHGAPARATVTIFAACRPAAARNRAHNARG